MGTMSPICLKELMSLGGFEDKYGHQELGFWKNPSKSCFSQICEHKERDSPSFVSFFVSRILLLGHWHITQLPLQRGPGIRFRNF